MFKLKKQKTDDVEKDMPLLWLDESYDLDRATKLAEDRTAMGLVEKGNIAAARYGLRFQSLSDLETFAKTDQIDSSNASMCHWKLTGIPVEVGLAGAFAFLQTQNWNNIDIIFLAENQLIFLSDNLGYCQFNGILRQLRFKATNAKSRQMLKDANQAKSAAAASTSMPGTRSKDRKAFLERVVPKAKPAPSSPRHADADKRHGGKTGETPDGKKSPDT